MSASFLSKDLLINTAFAIGTNFLATRFVPMSIKECAVLGFATSTSLSIGHRILGKDASDVKKMIVIVATTAVTYFGSIVLAPVLNIQFALELTNKEIGKIITFNAIGQLVYFSLSKKLLASEAYSDKKIKDLHKNPEKFCTLPAVEQHIVFARLKCLGLNVSKFSPVLLLPEEINSLTDTQIRLLYDNNISLNRLSALAGRSLLLRYFHLNLNFRCIYSSYIENISLPIPKTSQEVELLSAAKLTWFEGLLDENTLINLPYEVQWAFFQKNCINWYDFDSAYIEKAPAEQIHIISDHFANGTGWLQLSQLEQLALVKRYDALGIDHWPTHPQTSGEVERLDDDKIRAYHQSISLENHTKEAMVAFNQRFYNLKLPLPNGIKTIDVLKKARLFWPAIEIALPKNMQEVRDLHPDQLPWIFLSSQNKMQDMPFDVEAALHIRFIQTQKWDHLFSFNKLTVENVQSAEEEIITMLLEQLGCSPISWICIPQNVQKALNTRFTHTFTLEKLAIEAFPLEAMQGFYSAFSKHPHSWKALTKSKQEAFNAIFCQLPGIKTLPITSWY